MSYDMDADDVAGPGHNNPPPDLKIGDALRDQLASEYAGIVSRKRTLLQMAEDFKADYPSVNDDETSGLLAGVITQIRAHVKSVDKVREGVKSPYLEGGRIVDGFFNGTIMTPLDKAATALNAMQTAFLRAKAEKARREAEAAAEAARKEEEARRREAEKAEREARALARKGDEEAAAEAKRKADAAREEQDRAAAARQQEAKVAASSNADRSRVRGDLAMASLRTTIKFEVIDITKVPAAYLQVNTALVNAAIRGKDGLRDIPGLRIFEEQEAANR